MEPVLLSQAGKGKNESYIHESLIFKALLSYSDHAQVGVVIVICASPQAGVVRISP